MRPFVMAVGSALLSTGCAYKPGSFAYNRESFTGQRATVGCLDIAVERKLDHGEWPVLDYSFGNRCDRPAPVDLAWTQVIGRTSEGAEIALTPYDPNAEIRVLSIDGRMSGKEALTYPSDVVLGQVCVDVASIAQTKPAQWVCFGSHDAVAMVVP
ncbi:MAG: hypothetical protein SFX73_15365 [Kofleriaceae bacterium]|nr:hypothetical protein [Kofleriaceae bacterium]